MPTCYILYSTVLDQYYIGYTSSAIEDRVIQHNTAFFGKDQFTAKASDWSLNFKIECESIKQAIRIENHIKKMKSRKYIQDLNKYPAISERLLLQYSDLNT